MYVSGLWTNISYEETVLNAMIHTTSNENTPRYTHEHSSLQVEYSKVVAVHAVRSIQEEKAYSSTLDACEW